MNAAAGALAAVACALGAASARADVSATDQQLAQSLFDRARELMDQGSYAEACPKLAESQRLDPGGGTLLNLALCHEKEGRLASAWTEFNLSFSQALRDGRRDREQIARDHMAALASRIPHLVINVAREAEVEGLEVKLDGAPVRKPAWGSPTTVDPGPHVVEATAPRRKAWSADVQIGEGGLTTRVDVPVLPEDVTAKAGPAVVYLPTTPSPNVFALPTARPMPPHETTRANPLVLPMTALAVASYGTSLVTGVMALKARSESRDECLPDRQFCATAAGVDAAQSARTLAWASTITLGIGAVATIVAIALPRQRVTATPPQVGAFLVPGGGGVGLAGALP